MKNELKYMYIDGDFKKCKSVKPILELIYKLEFTSVLLKVTQFIQLLLKIPQTSATNEKKFLNVE